MRLDVLSGTGPITLTKKHFENGTQADAGNVTVTVTNPSGATVASGAATKTGTGTTTQYTFTLAIALLAAATSLRVTWGRDTGGFVASADTVEVSENTLFTEVDARTATTSGLQTPLSSDVSYPDAVIAAGRLAIAEMFEDRTGRSWYARYCRREITPPCTSPQVTLGGPRRRSDGYPVGGAGAGRDLLRILSCTVNGTSVPVAELAADDFRIHWTKGTFPAATQAQPFPVIVEYVYGQDPVAWETRDMALRMLRANLVPSDISTFATSLSSEDGTFRITALPRQVEEWLRQHRPDGIA